MVGTNSKSSRFGPLCVESKDQSPLSWTGGTYFQVCYSSNHVNSRCRHPKKDAQFVMARKWNQKARFEMKGDHRRQTLLPAGHHAPAPPSRQGPSEDFLEECFK